MSKRNKRAARLAVLLLLVVAPVAYAAPETLVRVSDAFLAHDADAGSWTLGNSTVAFTLGLDATGQVQILGLRSTRLKTPLDIAHNPDVVLTIAGRQTTLGGASLPFESFQALELGNGVRLDLVFTLRSPRVRVTRSYALYVRAPVIETWTTFESLGGDVTIDALPAWQVTIPAAPVRTVTGLLSDDANNGNPTVMKQFTLDRREPTTARRVDLSAAGRSSEQAVPWFTTEGIDGGAFFGGMMWSGSWAFSAERIDAGAMRLTLGVTDVSTTAAAGARVEAPHAFFGLARGTNEDLSRSMANFVGQGVRAGRPIHPLVTYNTWFSYGTQVDETSMHDALDQAARLGAELFVLDAGWYQGAGRRGGDDFTSGLGAFAADQARFPSGLRDLAETAESLGIQFGLWVEPERTAVENIGRNGLDERWLAMRDGRYNPNVPQAQATSAQICLGDTRARQWLIDRLSQLIDEVQPAYLKWDNNFWINCNRTGHGHGAKDGGFAHVNGLYAVLDTLRSRYPDLLIENVSGGGNRLDFGMVRYTDVAWMDDRSAPSAVVRHNLEGLYQLFPPGYLLSFVLQGPGEPLHDSPDLALYMRSRMSGALGLTVRPDEIDQDDETQIRSEVALYQLFARNLGRSAGLLLTAQTTAGGPAWDAVESLTATGEAIIFAFQSDPGTERVTVKPQGLRPAEMYDVTGANRGALGSATGASLMSDGIEINASTPSAAHIIFIQLTRRGG